MGRRRDGVIARIDDGAAASVEAVVTSFLLAVAARDLDAVAITLDGDVRWVNVPHDPTVGRPAVVAMLAAVIGRCDRVRWDVVTASYGPRRAHLERVDRFWIDGQEYAVACHGVFCVNPATSKIAEVRDYVDLGEWRARLAQADA
jgi:limonene-1,2-epoxide hydrolase